MLKLERTWLESWLHLSIWTQVNRHYLTRRMRKMERMQGEERHLPCQSITRRCSGDMSSRSSSPDSVLISSDKSSEETASPHRSPVLISNDPKLGRHIFQVMLKKEHPHGIGLTIVGGEATSSLDLGIFVKSVVPGGPADRDGRIMPGDRLIAIGADSLEGKQHHDAVKMIRNGGPQITLLVSQIRPPGTIKKRNLHDEQAEFEKKLRNSMLNYDSSISKPDIVHSKTNVNSVDTLLRYDDFVDNVYSNSDNNNVYNSDEKTYPLEIPSTATTSTVFPGLSSSARDNSSRPAKTSYKIDSKHQPNKISQPDTRQHVSSGLPNVDDRLHDTPTDYTNPQYSSHSGKLSRKGQHKDVSRRDVGSSDRDTFNQLREEREIVFDCGSEVADWPSDGVGQGRQRLSLGRLTQEEREHIQMLGDIAALDANDSSSDSDFDTAVNKTIKGAVYSAAVEDRPVSLVGPLVNRVPAERDTGLHDLASDVIYEVILENRNNSLGIVTHTPGDPGFPEDGVYIKEILLGSSADEGGIIAKGDRILEVASKNVETNDSVTVQALLNSAADLGDPVSLKVSRPLHRDQAMTAKSAFRHPNSGNFGSQALQASKLGIPQKQQGGNNQFHYLDNPNPITGVIEKSVKNHPRLGEQQKSMSISKLVTSAPSERTEPLNESLLIVPPPPPLGLMSQDSESNTQSDMDSDILDSSRSALENQYNQAAVFQSDKVSPRVASVKNETHTAATLTAKADVVVIRDSVDKKDGDIEDGRDSTSLDESSEFNKQLLTLKTTLDNLLGSESVPVDSVSHPSEISSNQSAVTRLPRSVLEKQQKSLVRQSSLQPEDGNQDLNREHDDDDDVVVTAYGDEPVAGYGKPEADAVSSGDPSRVTSEDTSVATVQANTDIPSKTQLKPCEFEILEISLKKDGTGFGFTVAGGVSSGGCYIKQLVSDPAVGDGRLQPGDRILKVNGQYVLALSHIDAVTFIRKLPNVAHMQVLRYSPSAEDKDTSNTGQADVMVIELFKPSTVSDLGFSLRQREIDGQTMIFVKRLKAGGVVHSDGRLLKGDRIIWANGVSFIGISKVAALSVLRHTDNRVLLLITRSDTHGGPEKEVCDNDSDKSETDDDDEAPTEISARLPAQEGSESSETNEEKQTGGINQRAAKKEVESRKRYISPRTREVDVPVIMTQVWVRELQLLQEPKGRDADFLKHLLRSLAELVEAEEHVLEFQSLHQIKATGSCQVAKLPENKFRNRYRNVLPFDENRVKLQNQGNDYINANYITMKVGQSELRYIACQGPIPETISDFWVMVWQEQASVIVMLTQEVEGGKIKCHPYWPQTKEDVLLANKGMLVIALGRSYQLDDFIVNQMYIENKETGSTREVNQIQYTSWPDHGVPDTALPLLKLLQIVHLLENGSPPIIHCSAGIGRTGSFIAVDTALATIEQGLQLDLPEIVRDMRTQRHGMIQTMDQYLFCYMACMEALLSLLQ